MNWFDDNRFFNRNDLYTEVEAFRVGSAKYKAGVVLIVAAGVAGVAALLF